MVEHDNNTIPRELYRSFASENRSLQDVCTECKTINLSKLFGPCRCHEFRGYILPKPINVIKENSTQCQFCHCVAFALRLTRTEHDDSSRLWLKPVTRILSNVCQRAEDLHGFQIISGSAEELEARVMRRPKRYFDHSSQASIKEAIVGYLHCVFPESMVRNYPHRQSDIPYTARGLPQGTAAFTLDNMISRPATRRHNTLGVIRGWIKTCDLDHNQCCTASAADGKVTNMLGQKRPKRLLRIYSEDGRFQVHLEVNANASALYAALSHCWGPEQFLKTTTATLSRFTTDIPISTLPRSFRDAIVLTSSLGIAYLWIDALCIVQDDAADWNDESPKMKSIFAGAYFTIAAAASSSAAGGCFPYKPSPMDCLELAEEPINIAGSLYPGSFHFGIRPYPAKICSWVFDQDPLQSRAWTLQERLVSRRILYCSRFEYIWLCRDKILSDMSTHLDLYEGVTLTNNRMFLPTMFANARRAHSAWIKNVPDYNRRQLSFASDKKMAVQGVADHLRPFIPGKYAHGVWEFGLPESLAWCYVPRGDMIIGVSGGIRQVARIGFSPEDIEHQQYVPGRAPSWSWLSVNGHIAIFQGHISPELIMSKRSLDLENDFDEYDNNDHRFGWLRGPAKLKGLQVRASFIEDTVGLQCFSSGLYVEHLLSVTGRMLDIKLVQERYDPSGSSDSSETVETGESDEIDLDPVQVTNTPNIHWTFLDGTPISSDVTLVVMDDPQFPRREPKSVKYHVMVLGEYIWLILGDTQISGQFRRVGMIVYRSNLEPFYEVNEEGYKIMSTWEQAMQQAEQRAIERTIVLS